VGPFLVPLSLFLKSAAVAALMETPPERYSGDRVEALLFCLLPTYCAPSLLSQIPCFCFMLNSRQGGLGLSTLIMGFWVVLILPSP